MADIFSPEKRSDIMSRIRSSGTVPEKRLQQMVRQALGHRWKVLQNVKELPGNPDIVVPSLRLAVFCDGCFYHQCPIHGHIPKSNVEYWGPKLERNRIRDSRNRAKLRRIGFSVWRFWEHDLASKAVCRTRDKIERRLAKKIAQIKEFS